MKTKKKQAEEAAQNEINEVGTIKVPLTEQQNQAVDEQTEELAGGDPNGGDNTEFVPRLIGIENFKILEQVDLVYSGLLSSCSGLKKAIEVSLQREITLDEFLEFLKSEPKKWLNTQYVKDNNISYPGLNTEKLIELELTGITGVQEVLEKLAKVKSEIKQVEKVGFYYPIKKLYNVDNGEFELTEDFSDACVKRFSRYTQNQEQNKILDIFERLCSDLNELNKLNVIRAKNGPNELAMLSDYIEIMKVESEPYFVVNDVLFWHPRLNKYREKGFPPNSSLSSDLFI